MRTLVLVASSALLAGCSCCRARCGAAPIPCAPSAVSTAPPPVAVTPEAPAEPRVLLEATWMRVPAKSARRALGDVKPGKRGSSRVVTLAEADAIEKRLVAEDGATVLQVPSVVATSGERATIAVGEARAPDVDPDAWIGLRLEVTPTVGDDDAIAVDVRARWRGLGEKVSLAAPPRASKARRTSLVASSVLAPGEALLVATKKRVETADGPSTFVLVVRPTLVARPRLPHRTAAAWR